MTKIPFHQIDVFAGQAYTGNPIAVIHAADRFSDEEMQRMARWLCLPETVFLFPSSHPEADYAMRIFNQLGQECHVTDDVSLGACHAWVEAGGIPQSTQGVIQQSGSELTMLKKMNSNDWCFEARALTQTPLPEADLDRIRMALHLEERQIIDSQLLEDGYQYRVLLLDSVDTVLSLLPDFAALGQAQINVGVIAPYPSESVLLPTDPQFEVRSFIAATQTEERVNGNLNGALAQWLMAKQQAPTKYISSQGARGWYILSRMPWAIFELADMPLHVSALSYNARQVESL